MCIVARDKNPLAVGNISEIVASTWSLVLSVTPVLRWSLKQVTKQIWECPDYAEIISKQQNSEVL